MKAGASWITIDFCAVARAVFVLLMVSILLAGLTTGFESVAEPDDTWAVPAVLLAAALNAVLVAVVFPPVAEPSTEAMLESTLAVARIRVVLTRLADGIVLCSVSSEVLEAGLDLTAVALVGRTTAVRVVAASEFWEPHRRSCRWPSPSCCVTYRSVQEGYHAGFGTMLNKKGIDRR